LSEEHFEKDVEVCFYLTNDDIELNPLLEHDGTYYQNIVKLRVKAYEQKKLKRKIGYEKTKKKKDKEQKKVTKYWRMEKVKLMNNMKLVNIMKIQNK
jgi:hypothetical protein